MISLKKIEEGFVIPTDFMEDNFSFIGCKKVQIFAPLQIVFFSDEQKPSFNRADI